MNGLFWRSATNLGSKTITSDVLQERLKCVLGATQELLRCASDAHLRLFEVIVLGLGLERSSFAACGLCFLQAWRLKLRFFVLRSDFHDV